MKFVLEAADVVFSGCFCFRFDQDFRVLVSN